MYVVVVTFEAMSDHVDAFREAVCRQAENSVAREEGCHRFDVSVHRDSPTTFFLYEVYTDEAAFQDHLASTHYADFSATVSGWLASRESQRFDSVHHVPPHTAG
jgi:autoinducer 2-degrading protein